MERGVLVEGTIPMMEFDFADVLEPLLPAGLASLALSLQAAADEILEVIKDTPTERSSEYIMAQRTDLPVLQVVHLSVFLSCFFLQCISLLRFRFLDVAGEQDQ